MERIEDQPGSTRGHLRLPDLVVCRADYASPPHLLVKALQEAWTGLDPLEQAAGPRTQEDAHKRSQERTNGSQRLPDLGSLGSRVIVVG
jgi:hypothetical protein